MSTDPSLQPVMPQATQFVYGPPQYQQQPREVQRNFVFVDEHNRHKRLKVMRACEGCRRRKIKCDAATTNTWPCAACVRLKLQCVRPNGLYEGGVEGGQWEPQQFEVQTGPDGIAQALPVQQPFLPSQPKVVAGLYAQQPMVAYPSVTTFVPTQPPAPPSQPGLHYTTLSPPPGVAPSYQVPEGFGSSASVDHSVAPDSPEDSYSSGQYVQQDISDLLGALKVDETGTAPYLNGKMTAARNQDEAPVVEGDDDFEAILPPMPTGSGKTIRIPPELLPVEATILHYFDLYFTHVHPYVPVLSKNQFYHQWQTNRDSISPLILEAIFAIAGRLADEPAQGQQWLALVSKHLDAYMDVPRLSTLQALLIVLKAREAAPKRGYYYRSWMTVVQCVQMGKDLLLDDHYGDHLAGKHCGSTPDECLLKTRIWRTIFTCELMIGSPQGRYDLAVKADSVDLTVPKQLPTGAEDSEYHVTRNFSYIARIAKNIWYMNQLYGRIKRKIDWGSDPEVMKLIPQFELWLTELPTDLKVNYPPDGSPPWLPNPVVGNMHSYYYLSIIIAHRPPLSVLDPNEVDGQWKQHMLMCYDAAKLLCRLQEAILLQFGLSGLQCMQRGVNFTIYCVLSCIVLHLVAITSPDPDLNTGARDYFTRHMRILEKCMDAWPMPDMQRHIDAVREAFSADTRKPFALKPSFPYGSPTTSHSSPPSMSDSYKPSGSRSTSVGHQHLDAISNRGLAAVEFTGVPISPPGSAGAPDSRGNSPGVQTLGTLGRMPQSGTMPPAIAVTNAPVWNPSVIFDRWNSTFGTPQAQLQSDDSPVKHPRQTSPLSPPTSSGAPDTPSLQDIQAATAAAAAGQQHQHGHTLATFSAAPPVQPLITPAMWQESVASVYEGGLKRSWDSSR